MQRDRSTKIYSNARETELQEMQGEVQERISRERTSLERESPERDA